jgi:hypothetical protein
MDRPRASLIGKDIGKRGLSAQDASVRDMGGLSRRPACQLVGGDGFSYRFAVSTVAYPRRSRLWAGFGLFALSLQRPAGSADPRGLALLLRGPGVVGHASALE